MVLLFATLLGPLNSTPVVAVAALVAAGGVVRALSVHPAAVGRTIMLCVVIAAVVAVRAYYDPPVSEYGREKWVRFCTLTLASMLAATAFTSMRFVRVLAGWWVVTGVVLAALALTGPMAATGRAQVDDSNPVWLGRAIGASLVIVLWLGARGVWRWRFPLVLTPVLGLGLLATGSRGPTVGAVLGASIVLLLGTNGRSARYVWIVLLGVVGVLILPLVPGVQSSRIGQFASAGNVNGEERNTLWTTALQLISDHPGGAGLGGWAEASGTGFDWPHNLFLEVLVEQGWIVGAALIILVVGTLRRLLLRVGESPAAHLALALLATETVHVSTSGDLNARTFFFVLVLGVLWLNLSAAGDQATVQDEQMAAAAS
ncbi:O-antigen ligase family protein [Janibacter anophelis]|uniref:O-antigen ligase family protein n=1 Tax=Janibacter anophelis TaxID=319054 RepID=UPI003F813095